MQNVQKRNLQLCMQKVRQSERFEQFCNSRMSGPVIQIAFLKKHLQFPIKVLQMTAKLSKSKNLQLLTFLATSLNFKENLIG